MNRREVVVTLLALGVSPLPSFAQQAGRTYRLGWFAAVPRAEQAKTEPYSIAFEQRLRELGFVEGRQPRLMATLERVAADRYRAWAGACPEPVDADGLRACAAREEEVAARIEMAFPPQPDEQRHIGGVLPQIAEAFRSAMVQRPVIAQYAIQAAAERRGAAFWRTLAASIADASVREVLSDCAELEERSAAFLEAIVNRPG